MKEQVLVDMDGVLADVYSQLIKIENEKYNIRLSYESVYGKKESDAFPHCDRIIRSENFFRAAPLMTDSTEGLNYLNNKYKVLIVSSATEYPDSLKEKFDWLNEHLPFIGWKQMIFCGRKDAIKGDIMIDDHPKNLDTFEGRRILFTQPHNIYLPDSGYTRVSSWKEIMKLL